MKPAKTDSDHMTVKKRTGPPAFFASERFLAARHAYLKRLADSHEPNFVSDVLYHDLAKVSGIYRGALGVTFPTDIGDLFRAIEVRHDMVHRNGKKKDGGFHTISRDAVEELAEQVSAFVAEIQRQIGDLIHEPFDETET